MHLARSSWPSWLQKPSQWRWPSVRRSMLLASLSMAIVLVFEAVSLAQERRWFLLRSAMQLQAELRFPVQARIVEHNPSDLQYFRINAVGPEPSGMDSSVKAVPSTDTFTGSDKAPASRSPPRECSPQTIDPETMGYRSDDAFHLTLQRAWTQFPAPVFQGDATVLCDENATGKPRLWDYCLPISGLKDVSSCYGKERHDLLQPLTPASLCSSSVLHMLTVDVYDEMKRLDLHPALLYGTLLGAVRDGLTIPFTEDADLGFNAMGEHERMLDLKTTLATKGYHMFHQKIWRVCVAPTHPLAGNLYNPAMELLRRAWDAPYVDLYEMQRMNETIYRVEAAVPNPTIPRDKIEPFSQVTLHGFKYDTVADPTYLLTREYGESYLTPKPRTPRAPRMRKLHV